MRSRKSTHSSSRRRERNTGRDESAHGWQTLIRRVTLEASVTADPVTLAEEFLLAIRYDEPIDSYVDELAALDSDALAAALDSDDKRLAFWINLYNAATQRALADDRSQYENRRTFFTNPLLTVAGRELSLDDIEHRILRRSYSKFTLGYLRSPFRGEFFERHELAARDPRIHFAVNCGAESCPPIAAYTAGDIDRQLDWATEGYLDAHVEYDPEAGRAIVPRLLLWFRGDFGRKRDIVDFLVRYEQLPPGANPRLSYRDWDWSLNPEKFAEQERTEPEQS